MTDISRTQAWLESLRPKTLPLAFAAIIVGTALAWWQGHFDPLVAGLALVTAGLLQILSNLANDYGDAVKGSDKPDRIGPLRGMQKGADYHRGVDLPVRPGAGDGRLENHQRFHWLPGAGLARHYCSNYLYRRDASLRVYWSGRHLRTGVLRLAERHGKLVLAGAYGDPRPVPARDRLRSAGDGGAEYQ